MRLFKLSVMVFMIIMLFSGCASIASPELMKASEGVVDLTSLNQFNNKTVQLDGEWEFYWKQFLSYEELQVSRPELYADIPSTWNEYSIGGKKLPGQGYATYRLHVKTAIDANSLMGFRLYAFSSAYRLYVNDRLIASNGKAAVNSEEEVGMYKPQAVYFLTPSKDFDIIIHVSNHEYAKGGFWYSMVMGDSESIRDFNDFTLGKELFIVGALTIISLFYLTIYILEREFRYSLYFSCLCLTMAISLDMVGQYVLVRLIPGIRLETIIFLWYTATTWVIFFLVLFMHELFSSRFSKLVVKLYLAFSIASQLLYLFTKPIFYTRFAGISNLVSEAAVLCTVVITVLGTKKGYKDGWLNIISMLVALVAYAHDILLWTNKIKSSTGEIIYAGLFIMILLQMFMQARRIKQYHSNKVAAELSFLQAQIRPHFLYNALNTFISVSYYDMDRARELLMNFGNYLRRSFDINSMSQTVPLKNEIELAKAYVEIEKARFEERLAVSFHIEDLPDVKVPILILQPIVENAVNHGVLPKPEGGLIEISVKQLGKHVLFSVKDNGVGMDLWSGSSDVEREFGSGVGLTNIDGRLRKMYGRGLQIKSIPGKGTEVSWYVPLNGGRVTECLR